MVVKPQVAIVQIDCLQYLALISADCFRALCNTLGYHQQVFRTYYQSPDAYTCSQLKILAQEFALLSFLLL
jgi:hypothetical protein